MPPLPYILPTPGKGFFFHSLRHQKMSQALISFSISLVIKKTPDRRLVISILDDKCLLKYFALNPKIQNGSFTGVCFSFSLLFVNSTVRSTAFTTKDIVVSGSDDRTVKVSSLSSERARWLACRGLMAGVWEIGG